MIVLQTDIPTVFSAADECLQTFRSQARAPRTQNFTVGIAALMMRSRIGPSVFQPLLFTPDTGPALSTGQLQRNVCDRLYEKDEAFAPPGDRRIFKPFTGTFAGRSPAVNNWRNSFDLQAGISCDAPYTGEYLQDPDYLAERRANCPFRDLQTGYCGSPSGLFGKARTCFNPDKRTHGAIPGPESNARPTAKLLTRGYLGADAGYWVVEPTGEVLFDLLGDSTERVPLYPFMAALYCGSVALMSLRPAVSRELMQKDLGLDDARFLILFNPDETNYWNRLFLDDPRVNLPAAAVGGAAASGSVPSGAVGGWGLGALSIMPFVAEPPAAYKAQAGSAVDPLERLRLLEKAAHGHIRTLQALATALAAIGYAPEEQRMGFDLLVRGKTIAHLFEVKTWRPENFRSQVRSGIAQLYEYRWRNRDQLSQECSLYLVFDTSPATQMDTWIKEYLVDDRGILPCWLEAGSLRTFPDLQSRLDPLLTHAV